MQRDDVVCLAEYCDIFRCDVLIGHKQQQKRNQNLMGYLSFGEEDSSQKCEPEKMALLEKSCHNVVRQCTITLEANVSEAQFSLVEEELIGSLCSFLTCEHYNDDLFAEESAVSGSGEVLITGHSDTVGYYYSLCFYLLFLSSHAKCPSPSSPYWAPLWPVVFVFAIISSGSLYSMTPTARCPFFIVTQFTFLFF